MNPEPPPATRRIAQLAAAAVALPILYLVIWGGTPYSKILYPAVFLTGFVRPVWALFAVALMGPLFLNDPGQTHLLATIEVYLLGAFCGEVRRGSDSARTLTGGPWRWWGASLVVVLAASTIYGLRLILHREDEYALRPDKIFATAMNAMYAWATFPDWSIRALWNWTTSLMVAFLAARHATVPLVARWLKLAGVGLVAACAIAFLDRFGLLDLDVFRRPNPDPVHAGRLQGTAGHAGWFAMWIVVAWPGVALWLETSSRKARVLAGAALLLLVTPALILTAARASWLGVAAGLAVGAAYLYRRERAVRPWMFLGIGVSFLVFVIAAVASNVVEERLATLLRVTDRLNYYASTAVLLRENPAGIGLGTHYLQYAATFLPEPFFAPFQRDHVSAHSYYLHVLAESGPWALMLVLLGIGLVARDVARAWRGLDRGAHRVLLALGCSFGGLLVVGLAQYLGDIRIIEVALWTAGGFAVGLVRSLVPERFTESTVRWPRWLFAASLVVALATAALHARRPLEGRWPRAAQWSDEDAGWRVWTDRHWRVAVDPSVQEVSFTLYRKNSPGRVRIEWPDGHVEDVDLAEEEYRHFSRSWEPGPRTRFGPRRWLAVSTEDTWKPRDVNPTSSDARSLGVLVMGLMAEKAPPQGE